MLCSGASSSSSSSRASKKKLRGDREGNTRTFSDLPEVPATDFMPVFTLKRWMSSSRQERRTPQLCAADTMITQQCTQCQGCNGNLKEAALLQSTLSVLREKIEELYVREKEASKREQEARNREQDTQEQLHRSLGREQEALCLLDQVKRENQSLRAVLGAKQAPVQHATSDAGIRSVAQGAAGMAPQTPARMVQPQRTTKASPPSNSGPGAPAVVPGLPLTPGNEPHPAAVGAATRGAQVLGGVPAPSSSNIKTLRRVCQTGAGNAPETEVIVVSAAAPRLVEEGRVSDGTHVMVGTPGLASVARPVSPDKDPAVASSVVLRSPEAEPVIIVALNGPVSDTAGESQLQGSGTGGPHASSSRAVERAGTQEQDWDGDQVMHTDHEKQVRGREAQDAGGSKLVTDGIPVMGGVPRPSSGSAATTSRLLMSPDLKEWVAVCDTLGTLTGEFTAVAPDMPLADAHRGASLEQAHGVGQVDQQAYVAIDPAAVEEPILKPVVEGSPAKHAEESLDGISNGSGNVGRQKKRRKRNFVQLPLLSDDDDEFWSLTKGPEKTAPSPRSKKSLFTSSPGVLPAPDAAIPQGKGSHGSDGPVEVLELSDDSEEVVGGRQRRHRKRARAAHARTLAPPSGDIDALRKVGQTDARNSSQTDVTVLSEVAPRPVEEGLVPVVAAPGRSSAVGPASSVEDPKVAASVVLGGPEVEPVIIVSLTGPVGDTAGCSTGEPRAESSKRVERGGTQDQERDGEVPGPSSGSAAATAVKVVAGSNALENLAAEWATAAPGSPRAGTQGDAKRDGMYDVGGAELGDAGVVVEFAALEEAKSALEGSHANRATQIPEVTSDDSGRVRQQKRRKRNFVHLPVLSDDEDGFGLLTKGPGQAAALPCSKKSLSNSSPGSLPAPSEAALSGKITPVEVHELSDDSGEVVVGRQHSIRKRARVALSTDDEEGVGSDLNGGEGGGGPAPKVARPMSSQKRKLYRSSSSSSQSPSRTALVGMEFGGGITVTEVVPKVEEHSATQEPVIPTVEVYLEMEAQNTPNLGANPDREIRKEGAIPETEDRGVHKEGAGPEPEDGEPSFPATHCESDDDVVMLDATATASPLKRLSRVREGDGPLGDVQKRGERRVGDRTESGVSAGVQQKGKVAVEEVEGEGDLTATKLLSRSRGTKKGHEAHETENGRGGVKPRRSKRLNRPAALTPRREYAKKSDSERKAWDGEDKVEHVSSGSGTDKKGKRRRRVALKQQSLPLKNVPILELDRSCQERDDEIESSNDNEGSDSFIVDSDEASSSSQGSESKDGSADGAAGSSPPRKERVRHRRTDLSKSDSDDEIAIGSLRRSTRNKRNSAANSGEGQEPLPAKQREGAESPESPQTESPHPLLSSSSDDGKVVNLLRTANNDVEADDDDDKTSLSGFIVHESSDAEDSVSGGDARESGSVSEEDNEQGRVPFRAEVLRKRRNLDWEFEGDMLATMENDPEVALQAVCALYRQQTEDEQRDKAALYKNKRGFDKFHAARASKYAEFLTHRDALGRLQRSCAELERCYVGALDFCQELAAHHSKQLFEIYLSHTDPFWRKTSE